MRNFLYRKLISPLFVFLKQGVSPAKLAWAVSAGVVMATIPVFGASTLLCLLTIWLFRLNPGAVLLTNQIAYPLQFILYFPFLRLGEWAFGAPSITLSISEIFNLFKTNLREAIEILWWSTLYGIIVWAMISLPVVLIMYMLLKNVFNKMFSSMAKE